MPTPLKLLPAAVLALAATACASIGRPEGGPRDENPPVFVRSTPGAGALNVDRRTFTLYFDENVELEDAFNKVVVSPVQKEVPTVSANGRRVTVRLNDTLVPGTTYTIDFGDAIKDLNEGNVLDGFAVDFSTGPVLDSLRISGIVLQASNLEPAQGIMVGAYSNLSDTAVSTLRPDRIARTNQLGQFTIRNLAPGTYNVYAINDVNRDFHWDRSEDIAFLDSAVTPTVEYINVTDTLYDAAGADSLVTRRGRRFLPNDVLLTWFNMDHKPQYLKDYARPEARRMTIEMGAPTDSLPQVTMVGGPLDGAPATAWAISQYSSRGDSLTLWLSDTTVIAADSLQIALRYMRPDSLDRLEWTTDTLRMNVRRQREKKKDAEADTVAPRFDILTIETVNGTQEVYKPLPLKFPQPVASIDTAGIRLEIQSDTLWLPAERVRILPDRADPLLRRIIPVEWEPGAKYRLTIDSAAIFNIYGEHNPTLTREFTVRALEDYSNLTFNLVGADSTAVVELLDSSDKPLMSTRSDGHTAVFRFVTPGTYYARLYFDTDGNGQWSAGIPDSIQPEEVAYYPAKLDLKRNWDVEQNWNVYELPVDAQKPRAILQNKPKLKRGEEEPQETDEEDYENGFLGDGFNDRTGNNRGNRGGNRTGGISIPGRGGATMQQGRPRR